MVNRWCMEAAFALGNAGLLQNMGYQAHHQKRPLTEPETDWR